MKRTPLFLVAIAGLLFSSGSFANFASAQQGGSLDEAARLTFESAREAFVNGEYESALARFRQAYELSQRPGLLYNIAQTLDRLRRDRETLQALRDYLNAAPDARNRSEVEARIRVLESSITEDTPAPVAVSTGVGGTRVVQSDPLAILHPAIFIATGGVALVAGGLAVWTGLETISLNDQYTASGDLTQAQTLYDDANTFQLLTNIFIFSAGGLGAAAIVFAIITDWGVFTGGTAEGTVRPSFALGPDGVDLGLMGYF